MSAEPGADPAGQARLLTRAAMRAARRLAISGSLLAVILGVPELTVARLHAGIDVLAPGSKPYVRAQLLVQLFHHLSAIMAGSDQAARSWLISPNLDLGERPINLIQTGAGLMKAVASIRAKRRD